MRTRHLRLGTESMLLQVKYVHTRTIFQCVNSMPYCHKLGISSRTTNLLDAAAHAVRPSQQASPPSTRYTREQYYQQLVLIACSSCKEQIEMWPQTRHKTIFEAWLRKNPTHMYKKRLTHGHETKIPMRAFTSTPLRLVGYFISTAHTWYMIKNCTRPYETSCHFGAPCTSTYLQRLGSGTCRY